MKMVKSLLVSAAGLAAMSGAQAADLPVKAKPVEYVKVCSLYGAGFYYIPGTDICAKIGGYVRAEWTYGFGSTQTNTMWAGANGLMTRTDGDAAGLTIATNALTGGPADTVWRSRAYIAMDTRQQTAYGTLRTFLNLGVSGDNNVSLSMNRAFIQIAGFTAGYATSYFDHYSVAAIAYLVDNSSDTGDTGQAVFAYTAQLGNGVSASLSLEQPANKRRSIANIQTTAAGVFVSNFALGAAMNNSYGKLEVPDVVANVRVDQAWGSAQVMGAIHQVDMGYYTAAASGSTGGVASGYAQDKYGWAVGGGIKVNLPMIGPGDYVAAQVAYAQGATRYVANTNPNSPQAFNGGTQIGYGYTNDAVVTSPTTGVGTASLQLTTNWGVAAGWEHFWTPSLRTSLHGSYTATRFNGTANAAICGAQTVAGVAGSVTFGGAGASGITACNQNWNEWQLGLRTQWNVTKDFYMGVDVVYFKLETASAGAVVVFSAAGAQPGGLRTIADQDAVAVRYRWHRDIVP